MTRHFELLARLGYGARGVVYVALGLLALTTALWGGALGQDSSDALNSILALPFGRILLGGVALGLMAHIVWRLAQGLLNADAVDNTPKGLVERLGRLVSAGANLFLALSAAALALGMGTGGDGNGEQTASAWLIQQPFGPWLLVLVGVCVIGAGMAQIWKGISRSYQRRLDIPPSRAMLVDPVCRFGLFARGAILAIVGGFLVYAGFAVSPEQAGGTAEALSYVYSLPFGRILYGLVALGLIAFGAYSLVTAAYRRINPSAVASAGMAIRQAVT